jgi:hypothetical protein
VHQMTITPAMYECSLSSQARPEISRACLVSPKVVPYPTQHGRRRCILLRACRIPRPTELTYCDSYCKRAIADGLNPFTMSQMPSDNSQRNSGIIAMDAHTETCS